MNAENREFEHARILQHFATAVANEQSLTAVGDAFAAEAREFPDIAAAAIHHLTSDGRRLVCFGSLGVPVELTGLVAELPVDDRTTAGRMVTRELDELTHEGLDPPPTTAERLRQMGVPSARWIVLPLRAGGGVVGSLMLVFHGERPFAAEELALYRGIADLVSAAVANARLFEELAASKNEIRAIVDSIGDGFYALDREWRFTYANSEAARLMGVPGRDIIGHDIGEVVGDPQRLTVQKRLFGPAMFEGQAVELEYLIPQTETWVEIHAYPSADGVVVHGRDVTKRREAEAAEALLLKEFRHQSIELDTVFKAIPYPVQLHAADGSYARVNPAVVSLFGFDPTRASREEIADRLHARFADGSPLTPENMPSSRALRGEVVRDVEYVVTDASGEDHVLMVNAAPFVMDGEVQGAVLAQIDVTQHRVAEDVARRQQAMLEAINSVLTLALRCDTQKELAETCLGEAERLTGSAFGFIGELQPDGMLGDLALSDPGWAACEMRDPSGHGCQPALGAVRGLYGKLVTDRAGFYTNDPVSHEVAVGTPPGHPSLESFIGVPLISGDGFFGVLALANRPGGYRDQDLRVLETYAPAVVEALMRKRAEQTLALSRQRADMLATLLEQSAQPFGVGSPDGRLLLVNEAFEALTGYSAEELREMSWSSDLTPPEYAELEVQQLEALRETGGPVRYEKEYVRKDGQRVPIELLVNAQFDEEGQVAYYYSFVTDLFSRKQRERLDTGLNRLASATFATLDRDEVLLRLYEGVCSTLRADSYALAVIRSGGWTLRYAKGISFPEAEAILDARAVATVDVGREQQFGPLHFESVRERPSVSAFGPLGVERLLAIPLLVGGRVIGAIAVGKQLGSAPFTELQVDFAARLMPLATLALENAELYERERTIADTLQEAILLPPAQVDGIESAYLYRPASSAANVGGDFYDVFPLANGCVAIVTGDVSGKGIEAARLTSLLRDGLRAYAEETSDAGDILTRLNALVHKSSPPESYATLFLGVLNVDSGQMRYCTAGHPSPIVASREGAAPLAPSRSPIVGALPELRFHSAETVLLPGEKLVLFTDGMTEARNPDGEFLGEEGVLGEVRRMRHSRVSVLPERLWKAVLAYSHGHMRDDTVVLVISRISQ